MIPFFEPGNIVPAVFLAIMIGIPTALLAAAIHVMLERVPIRWVRWLVPPMIATVTLTYVLVFFCHIETPESYRQTWALMMVTGFLLHASLILTPFPLFRKFFRFIPSCAIIPVTAIAVIFLLTLFGIIGGDSKYLGDAEFQMRVNTIAINAAMLIVATGIYGMAALLEAHVHKGEKEG